ncbi:MAG: hypothetical protein ACK5HR_00565 [Mycoplasmatales bacterium]
MEFYLTKNSQKRKVKAGSALYILFIFIPFIGIFIYLILSIKNKQFKGAWLNSLLISLISLIIFMIFYFISILIMMILLALATIKSLIISISLIPILIILNFLITFGLIIYVYINLIINANKYSLSQYLAEGYTIDNEKNLPVEIKYWIDTNKKKKKSKLLFLNF